MTLPITDCVRIDMIKKLALSKLPPAIAFEMAMRDEEDREIFGDDDDENDSCEEE